MSDPAKLNELPKDQRSRKRSRVLLAASLKVGEATMRANLLNLSTTGAQLDADSPPEVGAQVILLRGQLEVRGHIIWVIKQRFGVEFEEPIDESLVLEHIKPPRPKSKIISFRRT